VGTLLVKSGRGERGNTAAAARAAAEAVAERRANGSVYLQMQSAFFTNACKG